MTPNDGALRPEAFTIREHIKEKVVDIETLTDEEKILAAGSVNEFWQVLRARLEGEIDKLEQINESAISSGASMSQIGENTIVINLAKGIIKGIIRDVVNAKEALDARGETK